MSRRVRPRVVAVKGLPTSAAPWVSAVLSVDALLCVGAIAWTFWDGLESQSGWVRWGLRVLLLVAAVTSVESARLSGNAITWRRRIGLLMVIAAVWRGGPVPWREAQAGVVLWTGVVWVALFAAGRRIEQAVVASTGAEGLPEA